MNEFGVLNNRKRALIALIHSVVFLGVAIGGFVSPKPGIVHGISATGDFILIGIYLVVASVLGWLVKVSRCGLERIYFALCTCSATFGFLRTLFGDLSIPAAQYLRVILLGCAVGVGTWIVRSLSRPTAEGAVTE